MNTIKSRFNFQFAKADALFTRSELNENPALWLFLNDLRTPMFMMEALSRIYDEVSKDKLFAQMYGAFKSIEDALGSVDHYVALYKNFESNTKVSDEIKDYFYNKAQEKIWFLNELLVEDGWLDGSMLKEMHKRMKSIKDLPLVKENKAIKDFYQEEIAEIVDFVKDEDFSFEDLEADVHELRRKIRWLSIYPHALNGVVQLSETKPISAVAKKYITDKVVKSPYNVLPPNNDNLETINFDKTSFLVLSSAIAQLGELKDQGLLIHALVEAFQETSFDKEQVALEKTYKILGSKYPKVETLLSSASELAKNFINEGHLEKLIK
jgi:hypothetical protein